ncbi:DUF4123 domain-containing protein [Photorhabdus laumondii]|uniref:DUF4123 domain-containing protein n=1 Tax=Photorhabdus laumondii TaxID=2218628 RepID=UPI0033150CAF
MNANNRTALSLFIQSEQPFETLLNHLRKFTCLKNELTQAWAFFRFYHPNTPTTLLNILYILSDGPQNPRLSRSIAACGNCLINKRNNAIYLTPLTLLRKI